MADTLAGSMVIFVIIGLIIALLWIVLPFAVFGIKDLMRKQISESKRTNELLERLVAAQEAVAGRLAPATERLPIQPRVHA